MKATDKLKALIAEGQQHIAELEALNAELEAQVNQPKRIELDWLAYDLSCDDMPF